jgi:pimeloyl-ACP methyl ester carboxylesterase
VAVGLRHLDATGPAVVLAESFGGAVALQIALERPELIRRLVLVNTFARYPRRLWIDLVSLVGPWLPNYPTHPATRSLRGLFFFDSSVSKSEQDAWWELTADVPMRAYGHRFRLLRDIDLRARLAEIDVPALVFAAPNDWVVPAPAGRLLARRLPRARLIETPTGHAGLIDPRVDVAGWLGRADLWASG